MMARVRVYCLLSSIVGRLSGSAAFTSATQTTFRGFSLSGAPGDATEIKMPEIKVGDSIPAIELKELVTGAERPEMVNLADVCSGKNVAIFGVPGAFTPGCSKSHLPSFMEAQDELKSKGIQSTICIATNDAYVMEAWGRTSGASSVGIRFLADDTGDLTRSLGLAKETPNGIRTQRFSLVAENGVVTHYFSSAQQASDTWAPAVLSAL